MSLFTPSPLEGEGWGEEIFRNRFKRPSRHLNLFYRSD